MSMLGFVYLILILGWIVIILFLKCKKSITPHIGLTENYANAIGSEQRRPSVNVIQPQRDVLETDNQLTEEHSRQRSCLVRYSQRSGLSAINDRNLAAPFTPEAMINPAYSHEEIYVINAPPPSYDEVMSHPEIYPKVTSKTTEANT